jgi:lipopolysaccharide biosynthesis regulator YciM
MFSNELVWWITVVDIPALSALFWLIWRTRREADEAIDHLHDKMDKRSSQFRESLSAFKLEVAKSYATAGDMKDLEGRIVSHLLRIEAKLDQTALKTESLQPRK